MTDFKSKVQIHFLQLALWVGVIFILNFSQNAFAQKSYTARGASSVQNQGYAILEGKVDKSVTILQEQIESLTERLSEIEKCQEEGLLYDPESKNCTSVVHDDLRDFVRRELPACGGDQVLTSNGQEFSCKKIQRSSSEKPSGRFCTYRGRNYAIGAIICSGGGGRLKCTSSGFKPTIGGCGGGMGGNG